MRPALKRHMLSVFRARAQAVATAWKAQTVPREVDVPAGIPFVLQRFDSLFGPRLARAFVNEQKLGSLRGQRRGRFRFAPELLRAPFHPAQSVV
jgi:hypothetical protein